MPPWHLWRGTLPAGQFGPEGRWRETRVDYFPSFFRFTTKSNLKIFVEKIVHWNFFLPKYIKHNILHGGNSAIISFMPVDNVTACQSWSYCTLSNGHFYSKVTPDIFSTHLEYLYLVFICIEIEVVHIYTGTEVYLDISVFIIIFICTTYVHMLCISSKVNLCHLLKFYSITEYSRSGRR